MFYKVWIDDVSGECIDNNYFKLFIEFEFLIKNVLKVDLYDKYLKMCGWILLLKGYVEKFEYDEIFDNE